MYCAPASVTSNQPVNQSATVTEEGVVWSGA